MGALVALAVGAVLGVAAVAGASAIADPDNALEQSSSTTDTGTAPLEVLRYGNRG
ncbi:DUF2613 family protein [Blastococcus jejuensis]|uniref:DUF2613 family protein n=1 Tax=Blastococcus jejuensis TaxID=351224 RepID=UPI003CD07F68